ncbi:MAG: type IV secretory system conjugative DNA transfer family protein, partial [Micrococcales bacterium]|nr:type IV secretory system conjugative DNA transfer family protein [Micrococcales bacterium]
IPPPSIYTAPKERVFATTTAPGTRAGIGIRIEDALRHTHTYGPTGAGKSTLMLHLIKADIDADRSVVVIDPKRDLAMDTLALIPQHRVGQVAIIDPSLDRPAGINPFAGLTGPDADERRALVAEIMLDLFRGLFPNAFGPLTADTLHASFLTLTYASDASLAALPKLLTDDRYRRAVLANVRDRSLLEFWAQYEQKSPGQQANAVGPVMTRLRQFLLRPGVRAVLEQTTPAFRLDELFTKRRILIVSLNKGLLGIQTASLLGSLVVAQLWQLILARSATPRNKRIPVSIYIDEAQNFLHLGDLAEALEQSRSLGAAWHLAHQHRSQMPAKLLEAIDANARNKIIFGLEDTEAKTAARITGLDVEDFARLPPYEIYTSLQSGGTRTGWFSGRVLPPPKAVANIAAVIAEAQARYGAAPDATESDPVAVDEAEPVGRTKRSPK